MSQVELRDVTKHYGAFAAVESVSLSIQQGELVALLGPSGCGKTTTLRMLAGFVPVTRGSVLFGERDVTHLPSYRRNTGMVFQSYALFPHLTVFENVAYGLQMRRISHEQIDSRVRRVLDRVRISELTDRLPKQLSGGQQQRIALARALVIEPDVLLLDEPLSNLDAKLRLEVRNEIRHLQKEAGITSVFVTHDQEEAMAIADRIGVMNSGRLEQLGSAEDLYKRPASRFVAGFIGKCNFIEGRVVAPGRFEAAEGRVLQFRSDHPAGPAAFCFRPEHAALSADVPTGQDSLSVTVESVTYLGPSTEFEVVTDSGSRLLVSSASGPMRMIGGQRVNLCWRSEDCFIVD